MSKSLTPVTPNFGAISETSCRALQRTTPKLPNFLTDKSQKLNLRQGRLSQVSENTASKAGPIVAHAAMN